MSSWFTWFTTLLPPLPRCVVAKVVAVCGVPCNQFGQFNASLLHFQMEESEIASATVVARGTTELTSRSPTFYEWKYSHYFVVVEDNDKNLWARCTLCPSIYDCTVIYSTQLVAMIYIIFRDKPILLFSHLFFFLAILFSQPILLNILLKIYKFCSMI